MKSLLILCLLLGATQSMASRLIEVEDYYSAKTSEFIKTRYPRKAFSVYVKVDGEDQPKARELASQQGQLNLPFLNSVKQNEVTFWDRKDVSLGTLISYLKSIFIKVDIDGDFTNDEMDKFKSELYQYLKLSEVYDRVEINKKQWSSPTSMNQYSPLIVGGVLIVLFLMTLFFVVFHTGIRSLIKGLSQPLSEIGKSAESMVNSSSFGKEGLNHTQYKLNQQAQQQDMTSNQLTNLKKEIQRLSSYLSQPDAELIEKIEELGESDPYAMGAIFSEMKTEDLQHLVQWAQGAWWRIAITQTSTLSQNSVEFTSEIAHLQMKKKLTQGFDAQEDKSLKFERILARLNVKQFGQLLQNYKFEQAEKILRVLPQDKMINIGKYLYPGQWAELLESKKQTSLIDAKVKQQIENKALEICPLKTEGEIKGYFKDADLLKFLDSSSTKDEREVYRALSETSWIKKERLPFFEVFSQTEDVLQQLTTDLPLELWSLALTSCDRAECDKIYDKFNSKQRFLLREYKARFSRKKPKVSDLSLAKKRIINSLLMLNQKKADETREIASNEAAA